MLTLQPDVNNRLLLLLPVYHYIVLAIDMVLYIVPLLLNVISYIRQCDQHIWSTGLYYLCIMRILSLIIDIVILDFKIGIVSIVSYVEAQNT